MGVADAPGRAAAEPVASVTDRIDLNRHVVPFDDLPGPMEGRRVVQISDLHWGPGCDEALLTEAVATVAALDADYVAVTGDLVNGPCRDVAPMGRMVSGLRARRGVYAILGNHDQRGDPEAVRTALRSAGIRVLHNEAEELEPGFWLAGCDDIQEGEGDLDATLRPVPAGVPGVLLAHNPWAFNRVPASRPLLILSGHTHSGQWHLPLLPPVLICLWHLRTRLVEGWYARGRLRIYVNRGIGVTGPRPLARRVNCRPELTVFTLIRGAPAPGRDR